MIPLVLVPGMMCDARVYQPQIEVLSAEYHLHLASIAQGDTIEQLAHAVLEQAPSRFALAGLSMGGIVAMEMIAQAPHRIDRLALLDTNAQSEKTAVAQNRELQMAKVRQGQLVTVMKEECKPHYLSKGSKKVTILDLCLDMALRLGAQTFISQSKALQTRPDQQESLKRVRVPTYILTGEDDRLCPFDRHQLIHRLIPHSQLHVIQGAGHLPTLEQPEQTTRLLLRWLQHEP